MHVLLLLTLLSAQSELTCPEAAVIKARATPEATEKWCEAADGTRHGPRHAWYSDGKVWFTGAYTHGKRTGEWTFWYPSGALMSRSTYAADRRDGRFTKWHESGTPALEGDCRAGVEQGLWTSYWPNGKKDVEVMMRDGAAQGAPRFFTRRGQEVPLGEWLTEKLRGVERHDPRFAAAARRYRDGLAARECAD